MQQSHLVMILSVCALVIGGHHEVFQKTFLKLLIANSDGNSDLLSSGILKQVEDGCHSERSVVH